MTTTETKERPIIFSAPMVRAILDGTKTQTRRIFKGLPDGIESITNLKGHDEPGVWTVVSDSQPRYTVRCPYGKVGDVLWVRETWAQTTAAISDEPGLVYRATDPDWETMEGWKWASPIFMPRWASRLPLRITDVRVQRLQGISEEDAIAEGSQCPGVPASLTNKGAYAKLWESINGEGSWKLNPWVWAVSFERVNP